MATNSNKIYFASNYGKKETEMMVKYQLQKDDAKNYFEWYILPILDKSYRLYMSDNSDRAKQIQDWQNNVFVPYIHSVVETLKPRILDARPDLWVLPRTSDDAVKASRVGKMLDYTWEKSRADTVMEDLVHSALVYGTWFFQVWWKKDVRKHQFLTVWDWFNNEEKYKWKEESKVFYDAPIITHVDNYDLWYDWRNKSRESKQFWFKRRVLTGSQIKRDYPMYDKDRLEMAMNAGGWNLQDYASVRLSIKDTSSNLIRKNGKTNGSSYSFGMSADSYYWTVDPDLEMHETFEWYRPFDDHYAVMVNDVPILPNGWYPIPYNFKEAPFIEVPYLRLPKEFEGVWLPLILENGNLTVNTIKNQRLDSAMLNIHKMWIVNPLANINQQDLVTRPFGIIYSPDPNGVREVQFSDVKQSAYQEEESLKQDMRYASGVDDFSMGAGGGSSSATEIRHLRESTLERVRLFVNHLGDSLSIMERWWINMYQQFWTKDQQIRITGDNGIDEYVLVEKDDIMGDYDTKATVIPSIAGQQDMEKKQAMDLFQLLVQMEFIDKQKLVAKVITPWKWNIEELVAEQQPMWAPTESEPGIDPTTWLPIEAGMPSEPQAEPLNLEGGFSPEMWQILANALQGGGNSQWDFEGLMNDGSFSQAGAPIDLLNSGAMPPTVAGPTGQGGPIRWNSRWFNRTGKVNTNISSNPEKSNLDSQLARRANSLQNGN